MQDNINHITSTTFVRTSGFSRTSEPDTSKSGRTLGKMSGNFKPENTSCVANLSENPKIRRIRPNKNNNNNNNKNKNNNKNILDQPDLCGPSDEMSTRIEGLNLQKYNEQKIRINPNSDVIEDCPDKSYEVVEQKIRIYPDETRTNEKSGQIIRNDVIGCPDVSGQKDDDKNNNKMLSREQADLLLSSLVPGKDYKITNGIVTILSSNEQYILPRV